MSLQCLEKEVRDEIDFLHAPTSWFQHFGNQSLVIFSQYIKEKDFDYLHGNKTFWVCLARPSQSTHNSSVWLGVMQQKVAI